MADRGMKRLLGAIRRADRDFGMIRPGDHVAVGLSGGKDSLLLVTALARYRSFAPNPFRLSAVTVSLGFEGFDTAPLEDWCRRLEVPFRRVDTQIGQVVFGARQEENPCALCARMRRGALVEACRELGAGKLALAHHREDALETLVMSLVFEGRLHTFMPVTHLEGSGVTQIRPMVYVPEKQAVHLSRALALPVVKNPCPADGSTARAEAKRLLDELARRYPDVREKMLSALTDSGPASLWPR